MVTEIQSTFLDNCSTCQFWVFSNHHLSNLPDMINFLRACISFLWILGFASAASKDKPHGHKGVLESYDGKPLPIHLDVDQRARLEKGEAVSYQMMR